MLKDSIRSVESVERTVEEIRKKIGMGNEMLLAGFQMYWTILGLTMVFSVKLCEW